MLIDVMSEAAQERLPSGKPRHDLSSTARALNIVHVLLPFHFTLGKWQPIIVTTIRVVPLGNPGRLRRRDRVESTPTYDPKGLTPAEPGLCFLACSSSNNLTASMKFVPGGTAIAVGTELPLASVLCTAGFTAETGRSETKGEL